MKRELPLRRYPRGSYFPVTLFHKPNYLFADDPGMNVDV
jgi:hypothetical protein